ncbi:formin-like protein 3 isoform X2 [Corvus hawaiiensis]|uniref:formin-like protein 3 isoform X2 n=1 Tax=Corvus hawaiiensis TaxID=134902 RepID=UPI002019EB35|nr:formin-like protein 3 isoform X2 [Corvus hawaiiensis]XP_048152777.1 formin-like protein 3 isoform X2 [Corvus hawaiiensis]
MENRAGLKDGCKDGAMDGWMEGRSWECPAGEGKNPGNPWSPFPSLMGLQKSWRGIWDKGWKDLKSHPIPTPTLPTIPGCCRPRPAWPWSGNPFSQRMWNPWMSSKPNHLVSLILGKVRSGIEPYSKENPVFPEFAERSRWSSSVGGSQGSGILLSQPSFPLQTPREDSKVVLGIGILLSQPFTPFPDPTGRRRGGAKFPQERDPPFPDPKERSRGPRDQDLPFPDPKGRSRGPRDQDPPFPDPEGRSRGPRDQDPPFPDPMGRSRGGAKFPQEQDPPFPDPKGRSRGPVGSGSSFPRSQGKEPR